MYYKGSFKGLYESLEFPKIRGTLFGVLITRILLFRVLYLGPLFSETPKPFYVPTSMLASHTPRAGVSRHVHVL